MKSNVTLKLDSDLLREARVLAAERNASLSSLLAAQLEELVRRERAYEASRRRALARLARERELGWSRPADRGELHER